jgi:hypothetical protein
MFSLRTENMPNKPEKMKKVPKGALKNFLDAGRTTTRVIGKVERHVLSKPYNTDRATDALHPSAMVGKYWCHRASYYNLLGYAPDKQKERSFARELIFAQGHGIHATWQTWFAEMGKLYGLWRCTLCQMSDWMLSPVMCPQCDEPSMEYREVPVQYDKLRIKGHSDGWLKGFGDDLLLEIKSVGVGTFMWMDRGAWMEAEQDFDKAWANLKHPFESHVTQLQLYAKVLRLAGVPDVPKEGLILYEAKPNQQVKEWVVNLDDWGISHIIEAAQNIVDAVSTGKPPLCNIGGASGCRQCQELQVLAEGAQNGTSSN